MRLRCGGFAADQRNASFDQRRSVFRDEKKRGADQPWPGFSEFPEKRLRSSFSRPGLDEVLRYREHVDAAMERLLEQGPEEEVLRRIELGADHEEQHQELLLTDILHAFFTNPLKPKYREQATPASKNRPPGAPAGSEGAREQAITEVPGFTAFEGGLRSCTGSTATRKDALCGGDAAASRPPVAGAFAEAAGLAGAIASPISRSRA